MVMPNNVYCNNGDCSYAQLWKFCWMIIETDPCQIVKTVSCPVIEIDMLNKGNCFIPNNGHYYFK